MSLTLPDPDNLAWPTDFVFLTEMEITFQPGDEVHVMSRTDPRGNTVEWWKGYTVTPDMQGPPRVGMFPGNHVEIVNGNPEIPQRPQIPHPGQITHPGGMPGQGFPPEDFYGGPPPFGDPM